MLYDNLLFHNVAELLAAPGGGLHLARFPRSIWPRVESPGGGEPIRNSNGCEIRFVAESTRVRLYLRNLTDFGEIVVFIGNQILFSETLAMGVLNCVNINIPPFVGSRESWLRGRGGFAQNVCRVYARGSTLVYHGVDAMEGSVRPPSAEELPKLSWLAYGSSITMSRTTVHGYVNCAAQHLGVAVFNLGMSGSCYVEQSIAELIARRNDWDFASFELGINMLGDSSGNGVFARKVDYLLRKVTESNPDKPIFLITIFNNRIYYEGESNELYRDLIEKNNILRAAARHYPRQIVLVDGTDIATDLVGFRCDLLHPDPFASARMGLKLAEIVGPVLTSIT